MHQLVTGGFETTTSALNHGMWLLTRYPDVQERVRRDLSLIPRFIEEVLRFESPVQGLTRRATRDVEVGGVVIPEGAMVMIRYAAANRDASVFDHADEFDIDRPRNPQHLAFGVGPHFCVGSCTGPPGTRQWVHAVVGAHVVDRTGPTTRRAGPRAELHPVPDEGTAAALRSRAVTALHRRARSLAPYGALMSEHPENYEDVTVFGLDADDEAEMLDAQNECTFIWSNKEGWPVGVIMSYVFRRREVLADRVEPTCPHQRRAP